MSAGLWIALAGVVLAGLLRVGAASLMQTPRADALRDAGERVAGAGRVAALLERRPLIIPAVNISHLAVMLVTAIAGSWGLAEVFEGVGMALALVGLWLALLLVGDILPRTIGRRRPRRLAYRLAGLLEAAVAVSARATEVAGAPEQVNGPTDEDKGDEIELITSVLEFVDTIVREVMVPRPDVVTIDRHASIDDFVRMAALEGFSRIPVVGEGIDDIVGLMIVKDLLPFLTDGRPPPRVEEVMRPIDFVPETKPVSELLREMQVSKAHLAVVVDEYGDTAGIVTIEDLLEELVGEIVDEYDEDELLVTESDDGTWTVDGRLPVTDLAGIVGVELPDEEWDTVAGLVLGLAGRVPEQDEQFDVGEVTLTVSRVQGRRVAEVTVARTGRPVAGEAG